MALAAGDRLGPYEILAPLGAGGMGEVYRAKDTRLDRTVAVKVLPSDLANSPQLRQRLEREAKAISHLSHPHICALHDIGREGEVDFLVMEYLEGESLADRLTKGRLPLEQALRYGGEIADALNNAHHHDVVHRDLKPGNVMLTKSGAKLLDFGLAKLREPDWVEDGEPASALPTENRPLTEQGTVLGTYPYMSPEQLEGKVTDARTDLFALGAIIYEMVTGQRPFQGESRASLIAAIMSSQPRPLGDLQPLTPPSLDRVVSRCLEKDPDERWESAGDLAAELNWMLTVDSAPGRGAGTPTRSKHTRTLILTVGAIGLLAAVFLTGLSMGGRPGTAGDAVRRAQQLTFRTGIESHPAVSPNGRLLAYVSESGGNADIYLLHVNGRNSLNITEGSSEADTSPSFSPDGSLIAFRSERSGGGIFVMGTTGESVRRLSDRGHDPSWSPDGRRIVVSTEQVRDPLTRQSTSELWTIVVATGEMQRLYAGDAIQPAWSPVGGRIAFWRVEGNAGQRDLATIDADGLEEPVPVTTDVPVDWNPVWSPDGRTLYFISDRAGTMNVWRAALDPETGRVEDQPERVGAPAQDVAWLSSARESGDLAYVSQSVLHNIHSLRLDPERLRAVGELHTLHAGALPIGHFHPSPDGSLVAVTTAGTREDLYVLEVDDGELRQLTDDPFRDRGARWSPDGSEIAFYSNRSGTYQIWSIRPDGSRLRQLTEVASGAWFPSWSPDGARISFPTGRATCIVTVRDARASTADCLPNPSAEAWFEATDWSQDGRWLIGNPSLHAGALLPDPLVWSFEEAAYRGIKGRGLVARWLPDSRHILVLDEQGHLVVSDRTAGTPRDLGLLETSGLLDRDELALSQDGRTVLVHSRITEADIWLLSPPDPAADE